MHIQGVLIMKLKCATAIKLLENANFEAYVGGAAETIYLENTSDYDLSTNATRRNEIIFKTILLLIQG